MQPHQQRVVDELNDLMVKVDALSSFVNSNKFTEIVEDSNERARLETQLDVMLEYASILQVRIDNF